MSDETEALLKDNLSEEAFDTVNGDKVGDDTDKVDDSSGIDSNVEVNYKFKVVELFQKFVRLFKN